MNNTLINIKDASPVRHGSSMRSRMRVRDYQDTLDDRLSKPKRETNRFMGFNAKPNQLEIRIIGNQLNQRSMTDLKREAKDILESTKINNFTTIAN